jgi:hypothetical protein
MIKGHLERLSSARVAVEERRFISFTGSCEGDAVADLPFELPSWRPASGAWAALLLEEQGLGSGNASFNSFRSLTRTPKPQEVETWALMP